MNTHMNPLSSISMLSAKKTSGRWRHDRTWRVCWLCVARGGGPHDGETPVRHIMKAWRDYGRGSSLESGTDCCRTPLYTVAWSKFQGWHDEIDWRSTTTNFTAVRTMYRQECWSDRGRGRRRLLCSLGRAPVSTWRSRNRINSSRLGITSRGQGSLGCQPSCEPAEANRGCGIPDSCDAVGWPSHSVHFWRRPRPGAFRRFDNRGRLQGRVYHVKTSPARISSHVTHVLVIAQSGKECVCVSGWGGPHDEGLAECEWISGVFLSWWFIKTTNARYTDEYGHHILRNPRWPSWRRTAICRSIRPQCVSSTPKVLSIIWYESRLEVTCRRTAQELCTRSMENADGEVQTGATRADDCRRLDEEAWEQYYDAATVPRRGSFSCRWGSTAGERQDVPWEAQTQPANPSTIGASAKRWMGPTQRSGLFSHDQSRWGLLLAILEPSLSVGRGPMLVSIPFGASRVSWSIILIWRASLCLQLFGHRHAGWEHLDTFVVIVHFWFIGISDSSPVCVGVLVEAVSRYCHVWYRLFRPSQTRQFCLCALVNKHQYLDTVVVVLESKTEDP